MHSKGNESLVTIEQAEKLTGIRAPEIREWMLDECVKYYRIFPKNTQYVLVSEILKYHDTLSAVSNRLAEMI